MTQLLEQAFARASQLSDQEQDSIAALIIQELEDEAEWDKQFAASQDKLAKLADEIDDDILNGRVHKMGFDEL